MILLSIALIVLYTYFTAREEEAITRPLRAFKFLTTPENDTAFKKAIMKIFHHEGAKADSIVCFLTAILSFVHGHGFWSSLGQSLFTFIAASMALWISFDIFMALDMKRKWYYLGDSADTDIKLKQSFGEKAGIYKTIAAGLVLTAFVFLYYVVG
jgi:hypothetical protein